jgi:hypothetical protein
MKEDGIFFIFTDMRTQNRTEVNEYSTLTYFNCCKWILYVPAIIMYIEKNAWFYHSLQSSELFRCSL